MSARDVHVQSGKDPLGCFNMCADCPGFLVLGAAPAPASTFVSEPQIDRQG